MTTANGESADTGGAGEITLIDEEGTERRFRLHDAFDLDEESYYLVEAVDDPEQVLLLREGSHGLETVDEDEMDQVMERLDAQVLEDEEDVAGKEDAP